MFDVSELQKIKPQNSTLTPVASPPPPSASSRHSSVPSVSGHNNHNISISSRDKSPDRPITIPVLIVNDDPDKNPTQPQLSTSPSTKPVSTAKPKSTKSAKPPRSPSSSPPRIPPPPPPLQTIRLELKLGGPDNYEVDIASMAKATGQRPPTPVPIKRDTSDSECDDEDDKAKAKDNKDKDKDPAESKPKSKKKVCCIHPPFIRTYILTPTRPTQQEERYVRILRHLRPLHRRLGARH